MRLEKKSWVWSRASYSARLVFFLLLAASVTWIGCASAPSNQIGAFSRASADLANGAVDAYHELDESTVDRKMSDLAADPSHVPDDTTFTGLLQENDRLAVRMQLLQHLEGYAEALSALSAADERKQIDDASAALFGSLSGLGKTFARASGGPLPINEQNLSIIATAVNAIGKAIAEKKRREALRTVITEADPSIQRVSKLLAEELPSFTDFVVSNLGTVETELVVAYKKEAPGLTFQQRLERIEQIRKQNRVKNDARTFFEMLAAGAKTLGEAHAALRVSVEQSLSPALLAENIGDLVEITKSIKAFHDRLTDQ